MYVMQIQRPQTHVWLANLASSNLTLTGTRPLSITMHQTSNYNMIGPGQTTTAPNSRHQSGESNRCIKILWGYHHKGNEPKEETTRRICYKPLTWRTVLVPNSDLASLISVAQSSPRTTSWWDLWAMMCSFPVPPFAWKIKGTNGRAALTLPINCSTYGQLNSENCEGDRWCAHESNNWTTCKRKGRQGTVLGRLHGMQGKPEKLWIVTTYMLQTPIETCTKRKLLSLAVPAFLQIKGGKLKERVT